MRMPGFFCAFLCLCWAMVSNANDCQFCHIKRNDLLVFNSPKSETKREHAQMTSWHGRQKKACSDCHDGNNSNYLYLPATFTATSLVCARCHSERYEEWREGTHGKKIGGWKKGNVALACMDCHDAHSVNFKKMQALPMSMENMIERPRP